jgi:hypothetical protein
MQFVFFGVERLVMTGDHWRARVLRKQDPWSGRFFRVAAIVRPL